MKAADYLSIAALLISLISLCFSVYFGLLDKSRLKANSRYYGPWEDSPAHITVSAVNHGRRPIILTWLGGYYQDGNWEATHLGKDSMGLRLGENERYEETIRSDHHLLYNQNESRLTDLWFEDTLGKRYKVKNAKKHVKLI